MIFDFFFLLLFTLVAGAIAIGILLTGIAAVDRLDAAGVTRLTSGELFGGQSRVRRFAGWCLWAAPGALVACGVAWVLWGSVGATIGGAVALANMAGIAWLLHETELGPNGRRGLIVLGWFQIPVGVMRIVAEGL